MKIEGEVVKIEDMGVKAEVTAKCVDKFGDVSGEVSFRVSIRRSAQWTLGRRVVVTIGAR